MLYGRHLPSAGSSVQLCSDYLRALHGIADLWTRPRQFLEEEHHQDQEVHNSIQSKMGSKTVGFVHEAILCPSDWRHKGPNITWQLFGRKPHPDGLAHLSSNVPLVW